MPRRVIVRCLVLALMSATVVGQGRHSLKSIAVPKPPDLERYVADPRALVVLGKALFWDVQVSSDNRVACASCHFHAGADHRRQNQLATTKDPVALNWALEPGDFPFSYAFMGAGHRAGSAGVLPRQFVAVSHDGAPDVGYPLEDGPYPTAKGAHVRQVTPRNAPSVINAVYSFRSFWDGRASDIFTGRTIAGDADESGRVLAEANGDVHPVRVRVERSALASQAVGPPLETIEMSYRGRSWPLIGRKLIGARPLALQHVSSDDSVLGPYANPAGTGFTNGHTYASLTRAAFRPEYWRYAGLVDERGTSLGRRLREPGSTGFYQDEYNFSFFFGLAIQAYESTLVSDDSPYDRYLDGDTKALAPVELDGLEMFQRRACASCHVDPELTLSTYSGVFGASGFRGLGANAGFFYTGVELPDLDTGIGGNLRGAFKTPSLRNVELTGPYFHTGSKSTLEQIVDFYTSGGDYTTFALRGWAPNSYERLAMPALIKAFTDDRVRFERAPFDHPQLCVAVGHIENDVNAGAPASPPREAPDRWASIPAVGARGNKVPLQTFEELLRGIGRDGSRAHTLTDECPAVR